MLQEANFDIRYVETEDFVSGLIGDDECGWLWHDTKTGKTLGAIYESGERLSLLRDYFDCNFINAKPLEKETVERWINGEYEKNVPVAISLVLPGNDILVDCRV